MCWLLGDPEEGLTSPPTAEHGLLHEALCPSVTTPSRGPLQVGPPGHLDVHLWTSPSRPSHFGNRESTPFTSAWLPGKRGSGAACGVKEPVEEGRVAACYGAHGGKCADCVRRPAAPSPFCLLSVPTSSGTGAGKWLVSRFLAKSLWLHGRKDGKGQDSGTEPSGWILLSSRYEVQDGEDEGTF